MAMMASETLAPPVGIMEKAQPVLSADSLMENTEINGNGPHSGSIFGEPTTNGTNHTSSETMAAPNNIEKSKTLEAEDASAAPVEHVSSGIGGVTAFLPDSTSDAVAPAVELSSTVTEPPAVEAPASDARDEPLPDALPPDAAAAVADAEPEVLQPPADAASVTPAQAEDMMDTSEDAPADEAIPNSDVQMLVEEPVAPIEPGVSEVVSTIPAEPAPVQQESVGAGQVRPREEDDGDEPAAKRAKTESPDEGSRAPSADAPIASTEAASQSATQTTAPTSLAAMSAPAATAPASSARKIVSLDSSPITPVQTRFLIDQIRKAKKIKSAVAFLRPVDHVLLNIPTYPDIIKTPMDLSTIDEKLKHGKYGSADDVMADFDTMLQNSNIFNGTAHPVSVAGQSLRAYFDKCVSSMPKGEAAKPVDKPKKASPAPVKATRPARVIPPPTPTAKSPTETKSAGYLNEHGVPIIRRDSSAQNDRPKREIHPPKRDLPSASARPKKKKTQLELKFCDTVLTELKKKKYEGFTFPFMLPVDPVALNIPNYHRIIKKPMDFSTVEKNLKDGIYSSAKDFHSDVKLIFQNCYKFNPQTDGVYKMGKLTEETFDTEWAKKDSWIANNMPQSEPATEDEEEENEEEEEESEDSAMARMKEIQAQIAALSAEAMQLTSTPKTISKAGKSKTAKPASSKTKSVPKPAAVAAPKAPKPKAKPAKVRILTMEQKREVSDGIGTLDDGPMRSAVAIIRAGVPALANVNDDELELDIDEIPNDVLVKLWDFVRKHTPKKEREPSPDFVDDEDDDNYQAKGSTGGAGGRRKNKPMKAAEQVSRIAALEGLLKGEGSGASASPPAAAPAKQEHTQEETEEDDGSSESEAE